MDLRLTKKRRSFTHSGSGTVKDETMTYPRIFALSIGGFGLLAMAPFVIHGHLPVEDCIGDGTVFLELVLFGALYDMPSAKNRK